MDSGCARVVVGAPSAPAEAATAPEAPQGSTQHKDNIARIVVTNQEDRLSDITCPVLCFWGMNDKFCPPSGATKVAERCPNSRTLLLSRCGHWVMVEHQPTFNDLTLKFLQNTL